MKAALARVRMGWGCSVLLLVTTPSWAPGCGAQGRVQVAGRIEGAVRAAAETHGARGRAVVEGAAPTAVGEVPIVLVADQGGGVGGAVVSLGVPFPRGALRDATLVRVLDLKGAEVPRRADVLATWPRDGSIRSVLVAFRARLPPREHAVYRLAYGAPGQEAAQAAPGQEAAQAAPAPAPGSSQEAAQAAPAPAPGSSQEGAQELGPNPDGPIAATLPASWYAASEVVGPQVPATEDRRFQGFEGAIERGLEQMNPPFESYGVACEGKHRTYYDSPHALYQRFVRNGDAARYRRARAEAVWYRKHEIRMRPAGALRLAPNAIEPALAVHVCQADGWTPGTPLGWGVIRRMLAQGMLDDYLLTGDTAARAGVVGMGEAIRRNLPALRTAKEDILLVSERNMAWAMMALASYYAIEPRPEVLAALREVVDRTIAWQARGESGAFEHDISRVDPEECERGPRGGSPFMTALLVDALMDYQALTGDVRIRDVVARAAAWLEERALTSDRRAFRYLWGCETDPYDDSGIADLNLVIVPVFGAAYALTGEARWLRVGDELADVGVSEMRLSDPKHWNQVMRGFGKYLGWRARAGAAGVAGVAGAAGAAQAQ